MQNVSSNDSAQRDTGPLITYAIACVLNEEIDARGLRKGWVQEKSGLGRSYSDYMGGHSEGVPLHRWAKIAAALGMRTSEVVGRAEDLLDRLDDTDVELLLGVSGPVAVKYMGDKERRRRLATDSEDPPDAPSGRTLRAG